MGRNRRLVSIAFALLGTLFCAAAFGAEPDYVQPGTGFRFPLKVADFNRVKITPYNEDHSDVGVDYNNDPYTVHLSVYVYPATGPLMPHYEQCREEVIKVHPDAKVLKERSAAAEKAGVTYAGYFAQLAFRDKFVGDKKQDLLSQLILFRRNDNYVLYRISYAASDKEAAERQIDDFLKQFNWPAGGKDTSGDGK